MKKEIKERIKMIRLGKVPKGYKKVKNNIIPNEWDYKKIENIAPLQRGFDLPNYDIEDGKYPVCYSNGILRYHSKYKVKGPGVFTGRSGTIGNVFYVEENYWPHNTCLWVTNFNGNYPKYIYYLYNFINFKRFYAGTGVPTLNRNDVHIYRVTLPKDIREQQKITEILSTWDKVIELKEKLIEEKKKQKKGLMQLLLTGKKRLPGFKGEWKEVELKKICRIETGKRPRGGADQNGDVPSLGGENISNENGLDLSKLRKVSNEFFSSMKQGILQENDILLNKDGANTGKVAIYQNAGFEKAAINEHLFIIRPKEGYDYKFLYYYLASAEGSYKLKLRITSSAQPGLNSNFVKGFYLKVPEHKEQDSIGEIFLNLDKQIELLEKELEALKLQKKGLMQLLLTGIVRVKDSE